MKLYQKYFLITVFTILIPLNIFSQPRQEYILNQKLVPLLDSLVLPPSNCNEAAALMEFDSSLMKFEFNQLVQDQSIRIQKIFTDLTINTNNNMKDQFRNGPPEGNNGPPGGAPPGGTPPGGFGPPPGNMGDIQDAYMKMRDDLGDANIALDKINVEKEKFKDELSLMQSEINEKLHKTLESDYKERENIINGFLNTVQNKYKKYIRKFRENMLVLDEITDKYGYGSKIKIPLLKAEILKLQLAEITAIKFLLNVTKEFINIGTKFNID